MRVRSVMVAGLVVVGWPSAAALGGTLERRPVVGDGTLFYRDEFEFDDGLRITEGAGPELLFERTGTQPLRSLDPSCSAEREDLVRCRGLGGTRVLQLILVAGDDVVDASGVRSFRIDGNSGSGDADLTGGDLDDELRSDNGDDVLRGGPGDDILSAGNDRDGQASDRDTVEGGPGEDDIDTGSESDVVLARDGAVDDVDCGEGFGDVIEADEQDETTGCEVISLPADASPPPPGEPAPPPAPSVAPAAPAPVPRAAALRGVVRFPGRCVPRRGVRIRVAPVEGFVPARVRLTVPGRRAAVRRGSRVVLRIRPGARRRLPVGVRVTGRDGRRLTVSRVLRVCGR